MFLNKSSADVNLNYGDNKLLNIIGLADMNSVAIYSREVEDKYIATAKSNYGKILERATEGAYTEKQYNQIINSLTNTDLSKLTKEHRETMKNSFVEILKQYLQEKKM